MDASARQAFEQTALPELDALYGAALRLTRNPAEAQDLVQDAVVRAYRFWHTFKPGTSVKAWLFTILRNTFINRYHRKGRRQQAHDQLQHQLESIGGVAGPQQGPDAAPDAAVAQSMTREHILAALESIPDDYRMAIVLADLEGLSYKEIAEVMECPIGTVMSRIYRGRRLLHDLLRDHAAELGLVPPEQHAGNTAGDTVSMAEYRKRGKA